MSGKGYYAASLEQGNTACNFARMEEWYVLARARMKALRITQEQLAETLGVTQGAIAHWLSGRRTPDLATVNRVLEAIGLPKMSVQSSPPDQAQVAPASTGMAEAAGRAIALAALASERSQQALERIADAANQGRLSEADLVLLETIATRLEAAPAKGSSSRNAGSHQRLRERLTKDDRSSEG